MLELICFLSWIIIFISRITKKTLYHFEELIILIFSLPFALSVEIINEINNGLYYNNTLINFPRFNFPIAVLFYDSMFPWFIYLISRKISTIIFRTRYYYFTIIQLIIIHFLILLYIPIEYLSYELGYTSFSVQVFPFFADFNHVIGGYFVYWKLTMPAFICAKILSYYVYKLKNFNEDEINNLQ